MKSVKRKILLFGLTAMMSVSLAACGPKEESTGGTTADTATTKGNDGEESTGGTYTAGTYTATAKGNNGDVTLEVTFDSDRISLLELLKEFYRTIDPTSHYRQGMDVGIQYRTGIYYLEQYQKDIIAQSLKELQKQYQKPVVVENLPLQHFCLAEEYHQNYLNKNPNGYCHINIEKIMKEKM